jgi:hypothetical protein
MTSVILLALMSTYYTDGYFCDPFYLQGQILATDNHCSALYSIENGHMDMLISSPGCGRYYSISPDQRYIGFKSISEQGWQSPALYDLKTGHIINLYDYCPRAGQVSFSDNGAVCFTVGSDLIVFNDLDTFYYDLGTYANLAPLSPNGQYVVYNDDNDDLWLLTMDTGEKKCITDHLDAGCFGPEWSQDSRFIAFSSLNQHIFVYSIPENKIYSLGNGINPKWSPDNQYLIYYRVSIDRMILTSSDLYLSKYNGTEQTALTQTPGIHEMDPVFSHDGKTMFYHTYDRREIWTAEISNKGLSSKKIVFSCPDPLPYIDHRIEIKDQARDSIDVPYYHQVYDSPDWFNGHWACAPTTAIMAIAYYNKLPGWTCTCSNPYAHTSDFGRYLCELYHYREVDYDLQAEDPSGNWASGGYGYMWSGTNRPYTHMAQYLDNHDIISWRDITPTFAETIAELDAGYPYGMCVGLTASGHLVLAVGQVENWHTLICNDPYGNKNTAGYPSYDGKYARYDWPGYNNGYENLNSVYWCVGAQGDWESAADTIVDDLQFDIGFYLHTDEPSSMRYWHDMLTGYNGHSWWTYTTAATDLDTCYAIWTPVLAGLANHLVYVYIPQSHADATAAQYEINTIYGPYTVVIDQSAYSGEWVLLGEFGLHPGSAYVRLGDATGTQGQYIAFDAVRFEYMGPGIDEIGQLNPPALVTLEKNPVTRYIKLNISGARCAEIGLNVFDITGRCVYNGEHEIMNNDGQQIVFDASQLPAGVYILRTSVDQQHIWTKCIVVK